MRLSGANKTMEKKMPETRAPDAARSAETARIRDAMLQKDFYLMHRRPLDPAKKGEVVLEHFQWLVDLEKRNIIVLTGALFDRDDQQIDGLTLLRAGSFEEAEAIAATDPFVICGGVSVEIQKWRLGAGRITLTFDLSDRSISLA